MPRIEDYALLGDLQSAALVSTAGSVDWLCLPRFDSPACFAALLHTPDAGHWRIAPAGADVCSSRRYRDDGLVLETEWVTPEGVVQVLDFMPPRGHAPDVVQIVVGLSGSVTMRSELRLRFDYGQIIPWVRHRSGRVDAVAGPDAVRLVSSVDSHGEDWATVSDFTMRAGDRVPFVLTWSPSHQLAPKPVDAEQALRDTTEFWAAWSARSTATVGRYTEAVKRSLITLKALTYLPTGGIVAAVTTSLPEQIGGSRNWDYRYCWLRDSTYTLQALLAAGYVTEAKAWREWLPRAVAGEPKSLQIMYSIDGTRRLPEAELPWLHGEEHSSPVRTGNAASGQRPAATSRFGWLLEAVTQCAALHRITTSETLSNSIVPQRAQATGSSSTRRSQAGERRRGVELDRAAVQRELTAMTGISHLDDRHDVTRRVGLPQRRHPESTDGRRGCA